MKSKIKKLLFGMLIVLIGLSANMLNAEIVNPSFDILPDGLEFSIKDINVLGWETTIETLTSNYDGFIQGIWASDEIFSLMLFNRATYTFPQNYSGCVYQNIDLTDANYLMFDINLGVFEELEGWNGTKIAAFVAINDEIKWQSGSDYDGRYLNQWIDTSSYFGVKKISLGLIMVEAGRPGISYSAYFDNIRLSDYLPPCGGNGYYDADIDFDCFVDIDDLWLLCDYWLSFEFDMPYKQLYDINADGAVNFGDFALITAAIGDCSQAGGVGCTKPIDGLVPLEMDLNNDGTVNFADFAIAAVSLDYEMMTKIADEWLMIAPIKK